MDGLFSHARPEDEQPTAFFGITAGVTVPVPPAEAFQAFTDLIHLWWPLDTYSAFGIGSHLGFENQTLIEESDDGRELVWGTVRDWQPSSSLALDFFFGASLNSPTQLRVEFRQEGNGTVVALSDDGRTAESEGLDWRVVLRRFSRFMGAAEDRLE